MCVCVCGKGRGVGGWGKYKPNRLGVSVGQEGGVGRLVGGGLGRLIKKSAEKKCSKAQTRC